MLSLERRRMCSFEAVLWWRGAGFSRLQARPAHDRIACTCTDRHQPYRRGLERWAQIVVAVLVRLRVELV